MNDSNGKETQQSQLHWRKEQTNCQGKNKTSHRRCRCSLWHWIYPVLHPGSLLVKWWKGAGVWPPLAAQRASGSQTNPDMVIRSQGFGWPAGVTVAKRVMRITLPTASLAKNNKLLRITKVLPIQVLRVLLDLQTHLIINYLELIRRLCIFLFI